MSTLQQDKDLRSVLLQKAMQQDPMRMGEGAFVGLCESNNVKIVRGGVGFAVKAYTVNSLLFSFLNNKPFNHILNEYQYGNLERNFYDYCNANLNNTANEPIVLYLPDALSAHLSMGANKSVGLGGAEHELGHIICDKANKMPPLDYFKKVMPSVIDFIKSFNGANGYINQYIQSASKFCNVFADVRLERMMPVMYPPTKQRFVDVQKCIFEMENDSIDQMSPLDALIFMIRDIGKNHACQELTDRLAYYERNFPQEWEMVQKEFMDLIKMNQCDTTDIDGTLHFPMVATWKFFLKVKELEEKETKNPPPPKPQKGDGNPEDPCNGGGGGKQEDKDKDKGENKDKGDKDKGDKDKTKGDGGDDGEDEEDNDDEGSEKKDNSEKNNDDDDIEESRSDEQKKKEPKERSSTKTTSKDLIESIKKKIDSGDFNADTLDALAKKAEEEIQKLNQQSNNETYICNGHSVVYVPRSRVKQSGRVF